MVNRSKHERFAVFLRRLADADPCGTAEAALDLLTRILNEVEDEYTSIPFNPQQWTSDGHMYPPLPDSARDVIGRPELTRYRSRGHHTFVAANGAIRMETLSGEVLLNKAGRDGAKVRLS